jgi:hypothetical protein
MTDLVERLRKSVTRGHEPTDADAIEAADEIERLETQISQHIRNAEEDTAEMVLLHAEIERLHKEHSWQPIETAPKDGRRIIVSDLRYAEIVVWSGYWMDRDGEECRDMGWWIPMP